MVIKSVQIVLYFNMVVMVLVVESSNYGIIPYCTSKKQ